MQAPSDPISGYESRLEGNTFQTDYFKGRGGFMHPDKIDIIMAQSTGFNAGDFYAVWIAPMIAGRMPSLPSDPSINKCSLSVVGSILEWGNSIAKASPYRSQQTVSPIYGDPGLLMSWFYQPHNQEKNYSLCILPHYSESRASVLVSILSQWKGVHQINMATDPLFHIMDEIVKCEFVLSSSLHGIIFADSFGIPNAHMNVSTRVMGGSYKFDDYVQAVNRTRTTLELVRRTDVRMDEIKAIMENSKQASTMTCCRFGNAPMHAQAYNRTRQEHLQFAKEYAQKFTETLDKKPINLKSFFDQMGIQH